MNENIDEMPKPKATDYAPGDKVRRPPPGVVVRIVCDKCGNGYGTMKKLGEHRYRCMRCWKKGLKLDKK